MRGHRFTIYDALEKNGYFDANPANTFARDLTTGASLFAGPVEYPKMLFHPEGEERVIVPAEIITTPLGPKAVGEQRELLYQTVHSRAEEDAATAEGWWDHPAKAVRRRVELYIESSPDLAPKDRAKLLATIPAVSIAVTNQDRIRELERQIAEYEALKAAGVEVAQPSTIQPAAQPGAPLQPLAAANSLGARFSDSQPQA